MSHYVCRSCRSFLLGSSRSGPSRLADPTIRAYRATLPLEYQARPALRKNVADALEKDHDMSLATDSNVPILDSLGVPPAPASAVLPSTLQPPETSTDRHPNITKYASRFKPPKYSHIVGKISPDGQPNITKYASRSKLYKYGQIVRKISPDRQPNIKRTISSPKPPKNSHIVRKISPDREPNIKMYISSPKTPKNGHLVRKISTDSEPKIKMYIASPKPPKYSHMVGKNSTEPEEPGKGPQKPRKLVSIKVLTSDVHADKGFRRVCILPEEPQNNTQEPGRDSNAKSRLPRDDSAKAMKEQKMSSGGQVSVFSLLAKSTWSVRSLLPDPDTPVPPSEIITREKLHHLLRLSALPYPETIAEEEAMIETLHSQLHFVKDIQKVNTEGVEPLISLRDETEEGIQDITVTMDTLKEAFVGEEIVGARLRRPRRTREEGNPERVVGVEDWDPLSTSGQVVERGGGRYFVVKGLERKVDQPA